MDVYTSCKGNDLLFEDFPTSFPPPPFVADFFRCLAGDLRLFICPRQGLRAVRKVPGAILTPLDVPQPSQCTVFALPPSTSGFLFLSLFPPCFDSYDNCAALQKGGGVFSFPLDAPPLPRFTVCFRPLLFVRLPERLLSTENRISDLFFDVLQSLLSPSLPFSLSSFP